MGLNWREEHGDAQPQEWAWTGFFPVQTPDTLDPWRDVFGSSSVHTGSGTSGDRTGPIFPLLHTQ